MAVGAVVGCISGFFWYMVTYTVLAPKFFPWFELTWLARVFLIKDSSSIDDVLLFEYESQRRYKDQLHARKST